METWNYITEWGSEMINRGVTATKDFVDKVVNFFKELPGKIWNWLVDVVNKVKNWGKDLLNAGVEAGKKLFNSIVDTVKELPQKMLDIGKNIVEGLWNGIKNMGNWFKEKIGGFFNGIIDGVKTIFGIHSPSRVFEKEIGNMLVEGLARGIDRKTKTAVNSIKNLANNILKPAKNIIPELQGRLDTVKRTISSSVNVARGNSGNCNTNNTNVTYTFNQTNNSPEPLSRRDIRRQTKNLFDQFRRVKTV